MKITVTHDDGTTVDITEGVQTAYDCTVQSMDWGSGFLAIEDVEAITRLAVACRFGDFEKLVTDHWESARQAVDRCEQGIQRYREIGRVDAADDAERDSLPAFRAAAERAEAFRAELLAGVA